MMFPFMAQRTLHIGDIGRMTETWVNSLRNLRPVWGFRSRRPTVRIIEIDEDFTLLEGVGDDAGITAWIPTSKIGLFIE